MKILLDTNTFLWAIADEPKLSKKAGNEFIDGSNSLYISIASIWEIIIKVSINKLKLPKPASVFLMKQISINRIRMLEIKQEHIYHLERLPFHHRDPFDRLIISQSLVEKMPVATADRIFKKYGIKTIW